MSLITLEAVGILCMSVARKGTEQQGTGGGGRCRLSQMVCDESQNNCQVLEATLRHKNKETKRSLLLFPGAANRMP